MNVEEEKDNEICVFYKTGNGSVISAGAGGEWRAL